MDRKWLLGLGGFALVVLILAIVVVFGAGGGGPVDAARAFFAAIPSGGTQAAYAKASPAFRSATTADAWAATAAQHNLSQYASSTWDDAGKGGDLVTLNGVLSLKGGGAQPASVRVIKANGGWSVYSLDLPNGGVSGANATTTASGAPTGEGATGAGVNGAPDSGATPSAPSGAAPGQPYAAAPAQPSTLPAPEAAAPQPGYGAIGYPPAGYPQGGGQGSTPVTLIPTRVAHDCGPKLLRMPGVHALDVHCMNGLNAVPGTRGQCQALVNGQPANVSVTVQSYDPGRDDAELDCRLY